MYQKSTLVETLGCLIVNIILLMLCGTANLTNCSFRD
uniref:Uncharacterized protein n=1 Tax=Siphoviridae sp. ctGDt6 TaxID=2825408 RepID=A0A8S5U7Z3_9CAUD|nr:MAG TPA: hypothetical protein [Siphoviridae sp. ctGDt6]DAM62151.1 MAG TPA: hypothetical protein [Caudoviricetes sp.]